VDGKPHKLLHTFFIDSNLKLDLLDGFFNYAVIHGKTERNREEEGKEEELQCSLMDLIS